MCVDARECGNESRFMNHSCEPTITLLRSHNALADRQPPRLLLIARRDIRADEEVRRAAHLGGASWRRILAARLGGASWRRVLAARQGVALTTLIAAHLVLWIALAKIQAGAKCAICLLVRQCALPTSKRRRAAAQRSQRGRFCGPQGARQAKTTVTSNNHRNAQVCYFWQKSA